MLQTLPVGSVSQTAPALREGPGSPFAWWPAHSKHSPSSWLAIDEANVPYPYRHRSDRDVPSALARILRLCRFSNCHRLSRSFRGMAELQIVGQHCQHAPLAVSYHPYCDWESIIAAGGQPIRTQERHKYRQRARWSDDHPHPETLRDHAPDPTIPFSNNAGPSSLAFAGEECASLPSVVIVSRYIKLESSALGVRCAGCVDAHLDPFANSRESLYRTRNRRTRRGWGR